MKKRIGTPEEIARTILEMGERHLVIYCHPEDLDELQIKVAHKSVMQALNTVKNSSIRVKPNDICWREEYIMAKDFSFEFGSPWASHSDHRLMESFTSIDSAYNDVTIKQFVYPEWSFSTEKAIENINKSIDYIRDKHFVDEVMERNNRHQLMMEKYQFIDSLEQIVKEMRAYNPAADEHNGVHIIPSWADRIEALKQKVKCNA